MKLEKFSTFMIKNAPIICIFQKEVLSLRPQTGLTGFDSGMGLCVSMQ